jgi:hypothetical protein
MLEKLSNSSALIFNVLSVPVQFLQDVHEFHTDTISCTAENTQIADGQKGENTDTRKFTVIPKAPRNVENLKFSQIVVPVIQVQTTCHQPPIAAQKTNHVRNVEPSHPPFGGIELKMATIGI